VPTSYVLEVTLDSGEETRRRQSLISGSTCRTTGSMKKDARNFAEPGR